jgi:hypothetical protein
VGDEDAMSTDQPLDLTGCSDAELIAASCLFSVGWFNEAFTAEQGNECAVAVFVELKRRAQARTRNAALCTECGKPISSGETWQRVGGAGRYAHQACVEADPTATVRGDST